MFADEARRHPRAERLSRARPRRPCAPRVRARAAPPSAARTPPHPRRSCLRAGCPESDQAESRTYRAIERRHRQETERLSPTGCARAIPSIRSSPRSSVSPNRDSSSVSTLRDPIAHRVQFRIADRPSPATTPLAQTADRKARLQSQPPAMAHRAPDQPPQDILAIGIAGQNPVGNQETSSPAHDPRSRETKCQNPHPHRNHRLPLELPTAVRLSPRDPPPASSIALMIFWNRSIS